jgi:glycosyltransferase involved in cell wall biosynthesis
MGLRFGFLSTYPPTQCGIATFAESLVRHLHRSGAHVGVVRLVDAPEVQVLPVVHQWVRGKRGAEIDAALVLDDFDVAVVQHEYGIFGGPDGEDVLDVVQRLSVPVITVLHTVLTSPTPNQHRVLGSLVDRSAALVTMTQTARDRLIAGWDVDPAKVTVIPHGAEDNRTDHPSPLAAVPLRPTVLTWGLLSEGKGIEWALLALAELRETTELPRYHVLGRTHPKVLERDGEAYRESLVSMTRHLGLEDHVEFDSRYLAGPDLRRIVSEADVVLLPYDSQQQVTSGVLTEAVAAGKPVISTSFPHAVELLSGGAGILVPQRDPAALADALHRILTVPGLRDHMAREARGLAASLLWPAVAQRYIDLGRAQLGHGRVDLSERSLASHGAIELGAQLRSAV